MDITGIIENIELDLERNGSYDRYPVRFFSMKYAEDTANSIMKLRTDIEKISSCAVEIVDIKDFLPHEDGWVTVDNFRKHIKSLEDNKSYVMVGFSEYTRFLSNAEFITMVIGLLETENSEINYKRRIYIPCFALFSQIQKTVKENHRRMDAYNPFLNDVNVEDLPIIYFINEALDNSGYENEINNSSEWFGMWRNPEIDVEKPIICTSKILLYFYGKACPDNVYNIKKIMTYEELLQYLYGIEGILPSKSSTDEYYRQLLKILKDNPNSTLQSIILKQLNTLKISDDNIYSLWKNTNEFGRWLIQNYILRYEHTQRYLCYMMNSIDNLSAEGFVECAYTAIFNNKDDSLVNERKKVIEGIGKVESIAFSDRMTMYYQKYISDIVKSKTTYDFTQICFEKEAELENCDSEKISCVIEKEVAPILTDVSGFERRLMIWLYRAGLVSKDKIKEIYRGFVDYFEVDDLDMEETVYTDKLIQYFEIYRKSKILREMATAYDNELLQWNEDENTFYSWYTDVNLEYPEVILKKQAFEGNTYVLDGVGGEFLEYIVNALRKRNIDVDYCAYSKSHLPSITSVAKEFYNMKNTWILDYDKNVVHGQIYYPVICMEDSLKTIEKMIDKILIEEGDNSFAITADHGSTVGHKIFKREKKYSFVHADHDGRCYKLSENEHQQSTVDYLSYIDEKNREWLISLNEQSLNNNSKYIVHGGATPEEVVIPVIIAHKSNTQSRTYKVKIVDVKVSGLDKKVIFKINPKPDKVRLQAKDGTDILMKYDTLQKVWYEELERGIEQDIKVTVGSQEFIFRTVPTTKMGDDLFDD